MSGSSLGAVCATPVLLGSLYPSKERFHRKDWQVRAAESVVDTPCNLDGRLMAFRKELLPRLPDDTVIDDFEVTLLLRKRSLRSAVIPDVHVYETCPGNARDEFLQLRRRAASIIHSLWKYRGMLFNPEYGAYGKLILPSRRLGPMLLPFFTALAVLAAFVLWPGVTAGIVALGVLGCAIRGDLFPLLQLGAISAAWIDVICGDRPHLNWSRKRA